MNDEKTIEFQLLPFAQFRSISLCFTLRDNMDNMDDLLIIYF